MLLKYFWAIVVLVGLVSYLPTANGQGVNNVANIEGISEFRLENGIPVLIFPDDSKPQFTVNMTVLVGSRHEGYGETGMAHLLEHMLFKGTERHKDIPALLKERGVLNMNGTTWFDRTNYYETLPAGDENLEFAIRMEADRLLNSLIRAEDLASEMTVVRNEFEIGENDPNSILMQRIMATAFEWHNYGKSTIGNRSDIEQVPVENLRAFYEKYYQPDNVMVVVAGKFDQDKALEYLEKYFGTLKLPSRELPKTYTAEPVQDGERVVVLRRTGDVQMVGIGYHVPSAADDDFAALDVLGTILEMTPSGRLYKSMVETKIASSVSTTLIPGHDPGYLMCFATVPKSGDLEVAKSTLIGQVESIGENGVSDAEVERAVLRLQKQRERQFADSETTAINLSEFYGYGNWKLYFHYRDQLEKVTVADVKRVAQEYLLPSNRTLGLFEPTSNPIRAKLPATIAAQTMLADYSGRESIASGEEFDPTPANIEAMTTKGKLKSGLQYALLPKKTRGEVIIATGKIHFGNLDSLQNMATAADMLGLLMNRGTKALSYEAYRDTLDREKTNLSISTSAGTLSFSIQTKAGHLENALELLRQVLQEPALEAKEFEIIRTQQITQLEKMISDPQGKAFATFSHLFNRYEKSDPRYAPTIEEQVEMLKAVTLDDVKAVYNQIGGAQGEVAIVGNFELDSALPELEKTFANWKSSVAYTRIPDPAPTDVEGQVVVIDTPDKANAVYISGQALAMNKSHPDYEAMVIGNYILGGGPLSSRLADRVRKKEGLSYGVGSMFQADAIDESARLMSYAFSNPENSEKVKETIAEEVKLLAESGVRPEELQKAKESFLETRIGGRAEDPTLAAILIENLETGRNMSYYENSDDKIRMLTKDQVDEVLKRSIDPTKTIIVTAGDFKKGGKTPAKVDEK